MIRADDPPRLALSTNAFTRVALLDAVPRVAALGFDGVEILADEPHAFPLPLPASRVAALRTALLLDGLKVSNVNANTARGFFADAPPEPVFEPSLASPKNAHRAWRVEFTKRAIDLARALGAGSVSITTGRPLVEPRRAHALLEASLLEVLEHARSCGVRVAVEYEPGLLVERLDELLELLDRVSSPWLAANVDVAHAQVNGEDPAEVVRALGGNVAHVHAADVKRRKHYHLVPGEGDVRWPELFDALRSVRYEGFVTLELYTYAHAPDEAAGAGLKHLQGALAPRPDLRR